MERYSTEFKEEAVGRMRDGSTSVRDLAEELGVCTASLYYWERASRGIPRGNTSKNKELNGWSSEAKYNEVVATSTMTEHEKAEYCRSKGIYIEQLKKWEKHVRMLIQNRQRCNSHYARNCVKQRKVKQS